MRDKEGSFLGLAYDVRKPYERRPGNLDGLLHPAEGGAARLPLFASSRGRGTDRRRERPTLPSLAIHLGRTKTSNGDHDEVVYLTGQPVKALSA